MAKFDYKNWITENKYGIINEQTGSMTGSFNASCPVGMTTVQVGDPYGDGANIANESYAYLCANPQEWYDAYSPYFGMAEGWNAEGSYISACCTGSMATTGCDGFANLPQDFQDTICQSCENPDYVNMHCECCPGGSGIASIPTGSMATGSMATGSMAQGMPSPQGRSKPKLKPQRKRPQRKRPTRGLKEVKNLIKKLIKEQKPVGGGNLAPLRGDRPTRPNNVCAYYDEAPNPGNLSSEYIESSFQSWGFNPDGSLSSAGNTFCMGPCMGSTLPTGGAGPFTYSSQDTVVFCGCCPNYSQFDMPVLRYRCGTNGCEYTAIQNPQFATLEECQASGCTGVSSEPQGMAVQQGKGKMPMKRKMPMKENNLLKELKRDLKRNLKRKK